MGLAAYDTAVLNKIQEWFSNTIYAHTAVTYNVIYDLIDGTTQDKANMKFPLINIYRIPGFRFSDNKNFAARKRGMNLNHVDEITFEDRILSGRYLSLDLTYQLDFYSKSSEGLYDLILQVAQALNQFPVVEVTHHDNKTGEKFTERYEMVVLGDSTEQSEFNNNDRIYRAYLQYEIKNARLFDITEYMKVKETDIKIVIKDTDLEDTH